MIDDSYEVRKNSKCFPTVKSQPYDKTVKSFSEAKRICNRDPSCAMISGEYVDFFEDFRLCDKNATIYDSGKYVYDLENLVYIKKGKYFDIVRKKLEIFLISP